MTRIEEILIADVVVVVLSSECEGCGTVGFNYMYDRECMALACVECIEKYPCPCRMDEKELEQLVI